MVQIASSVRQVPLSSIVFNDKLYPRKQHDPSLVQRYALVIEEIEARHNYMSIAADGTLLDGRHRHLAYLKRNENQSDADIRVPVYWYEAADDEAKFEIAIDLNSSHGQQLSPDDKHRCVLDLYQRYHWDMERIAQVVSIRKSQALDWTRAIRDEEEHRLNEDIFDMWLACQSHDDIAIAVGVSRQTVTNKVGVLPEKFPGTALAKLSKFEDEDWRPPLYNVWHFSRSTNEVDHFGKSEQRIVENLLYLYTQPFDIVVDPFAGGGATIDVCRKRLRRYWVSDRKPLIERESDIRKHDIVTDGAPSNLRWSDVTLTYLDPPYWRQAAGQYSKDPTDLANMDLDEFTAQAVKLIREISRRQSKGVIALLMQPTQWLADERQFTDHVFQIISAVGNKKLRVINRVSCPYESEQYNAQQVTWAKEQHELLVLTRELVIWKIETGATHATA